MTVKPEGFPEKTPPQNYTTGARMINIMNNVHETHDLFTHKDFIGEEKQSRLGRMVILGRLKACKKCDSTGDGLNDICGKSDLYPILEFQPSDTFLAKQIIELQKEKANLINLLVKITHHEGALDDHKEEWVPIVQNELKSRMSAPGE